jgi:hypothetical protein
MVPRLVPVAVETRQQMRNEATAKPPPCPDQGVDKSAGVDQARQHPGKQPGENHQQDDGLAHSPNDRVGPLRTVDGQQHGQGEGRRQNRPEAAFVGCSRETEPGHPDEKQYKRGESPEDSAAELEDVGGVGWIVQGN